MGYSKEELKQYINEIQSKDIQKVARELFFIRDLGTKEETTDNDKIILWLANHDILLREHGPLLAIRDAIDRNTEAVLKMDEITVTAFRSIYRRIFK